MEILESENDLTLEEENLKTRFNDLAADLISGDDTFLSRLFSHQPGITIDLDELCIGLEIDPELQKLREELPGNIVVTWIEYSNPDWKSNNSIILFLAESPLWYQTSVYNKRLFEEKE